MRAAAKKLSNVKDQSYRGHMWPWQGDEERSGVGGYAIVRLGMFAMNRVK